MTPLNQGAMQRDGVPLRTSPLRLLEGSTQIKQEFFGLGFKPHRHAQVGGVLELAPDLAVCFVHLTLELHLIAWLGCGRSGYTVVIGYLVCLGLDHPNPSHTRRDVVSPTCHRFFLNRRGTDRLTGQFLPRFRDGHDHCAGGTKHIPVGRERTRVVEITMQRVNNVFLWGERSRVAKICSCVVGEQGHGWVVVVASA